MTRYICPVCGYVHDEAANERFDDLPAAWKCPVCGAEKSVFEPEDDMAEAADGPASSASAAFPQKALPAHRVLGYVYLAVYVILIAQMIPRLWSYQIEFPARTVVHLSLGMVVGVLLLLKICIVRFFRRLDQALVPQLGTSLLVSSVVLIGISVPWALREAFVTSQLFSPESQTRVKELLAQAGLNDSECARFSSAQSLRQGQQVLRSECIGCHDLRTVLAKPRTPALWRQTVRRMAGRTTMVNPIAEDEQWQVTAYLTALSPQLQRSTQQLSEQQEVRADSRQAAEAIATQEGGGAGADSYDADEAEALVAAKCSQCHDASLVADAPPQSEQQVRDLVASMVDEGMDATESELSMIVEYLKRNYLD